MVIVLHRINKALAFAGVLLLTYGIWNFGNGLFQSRIEKVETLQVSDVIGTKERRGVPIYVHPNKGVGPIQGEYNLAFRVDYKYVNGTLHIEDYYSDFGKIGLEAMHLLNSKVITGNGSIVFNIDGNYVGLHYIFFTPEYTPSYSPAAEVRVFTINYEPGMTKDLILFGLVLSLIGVAFTSGAIATKLIT